MSHVHEIEPRLQTGLASHAVRFDDPASAAILGQAAYITGELHDKRHIARGVAWLCKWFKHVRIVPLDTEAALFYAWQSLDAGPRDLTPNQA